MHRALIGLLMVGFCAAESKALEIGAVDVVAESHRVWGYAAGTNQSDSFDITADHPVSGLAAADYYVEGYGWVDNQVCAASTNNIAAARSGDPLIVAVEAIDDGFSWEFSGCYANARATYVFAPLTSVIDVAFTGTLAKDELGNEASFVLRDLTDDVVIDADSWTSETGLVIDVQRGYAVSPSHEYSLELNSGIQVLYEVNVESHLTAMITPEPASLLLVGLAGVMVRRR